MTPTETIRAMLDERGVEWRVGGETRHNKSTIWECEAGTAEFYEDLSNGFTRLVLQHRDGMTRLTITSDMTPPECFVTPEQAIAATLGRGMLSASQVSNAVYAHSIHADCADADWQAIADELNATLGRGTCRLIDSGPWGHPYVCSACGASFDPEVYDGKLNYCPNCGAKVEDE